MKSSFRFVINKTASLKFFFMFFYNLYKYNLIISALDFVNNKEVSFISTLNSINNEGAFFRFFFTFFSCNSCRYNLIIFIFNKKVIINNIQ